MSKTIVYIGGFELPDKNAAAHRVLSNGKAFRELGYNVVFIDSSKDPDTSREILQTKKEHYGFETYSVRYPKGAKAWIKYLTDVKSYIKVIEKQQNVCMVILYNFQAIAMRKLLNYCKKKDIKCCADVTEWRSAKGEGVVYRLLKDSDTWYRMKVLHKKLDGLIVISSYLQKFYSDVKNVVRIPTLVDISEEKWKNPYSKSLDILKLVYAGNPGMKDKLDVLISALEHIKKPYILDIVGLTKEQFLRYYPEFEKKLDSNGVVFHGRISHSETLNYVKQASFSCFFRDDDRVSNSGFPTKLAEALTCGTPVLTNRTSDIADYIGESNGILVDKISPKSIANALNSAQDEISIDSSMFDYHSFISVFKIFLSEGSSK